MHQQILASLKRLEKNENITILYACESGSRAWGFPSADSDYDVRFIYIRAQDWYLRVDHAHCRDVIEQPIHDLLDINGWDLKKALQLLRKSNPSLLEWFSSPTVYRQNSAFSHSFKILLQQYYSPKACYYHYSHMANGNFREYLQGEQVRIKKYFYVLRPILAMQWIAQNRGVVPMAFEVLLDALVDDGELKIAVQQLLKHKRKGFEYDYQPKIEIINQFIKTELKHFENKPIDQIEINTDFSPLTAFFIAVLNGDYAHVSM